jgi:DNA-directed RNA polymerase subunit H (RpoH/RPB5)
MFNIYTNVRLCMENQNIVLKTPELSQADLMSALNKTQYVVMEGLRRCKIRGDASIAICVIDKDSKYSHGSNDFKSLLNAMPKANELFIICKEDLSSHIDKQIELFKTTNENTKLYIFPYRCFIMNLLTHSLSVKHEIVSQEEAIALGKFPHYIHPEHLPRIKETDVQAIWIGLRTHQICRIYRPSETAGEQIIYRYCK